MVDDRYIDRLSVDLKLQLTSLPYEAQEAADSIVDEHVIPAVESVLKEWKGTADVSIPQIEIDLGRIRLQDLRPMIESRLKSALEAYMGPSSLTIDMSLSVADSLKEFAGTGRIPWEKEGTPFHPSRYLREMLVKDADALTVLLETFSERELAGLLVAVSSAGAPDEDDRRILDLIQVRLMQDYPETASILSARVASWHDAMGGALAGSRASTPAVQGFKYVEIELKEIPEGTPVGSMEPVDFPGPDAPEFIMDFGPPMKYYRKVAVGGEDRPEAVTRGDRHPEMSVQVDLRPDIPVSELSRSVPFGPSFHYVEIELKEIPEGASVASMEPLDTPGADAPEFIMDFGPPMKYYRKVVVGGEDRPEAVTRGDRHPEMSVQVDLRPDIPVSELSRSVPFGSSFHYEEIELEEIPEGAPVEAMEPLDNPGPDAPEFIVDFGPSVKYYRKVAAAGDGRSDQYAGARPEVSAGGETRSERSAEGVLHPDVAASRSVPVPSSYRYVEIGLREIPEGVPVVPIEPVDFPGPDAPEFIMDFGPPMRYYRKVAVGRSEVSVQKGRHPEEPVEESTRSALSSFRYVVIDRRDIPEGVSVEAMDRLENPGPDDPVYVRQADAPGEYFQKVAVNQDVAVDRETVLDRESEIWAVRDFETEWNGERIPISDAGLVLVHPFFHLLMQNLGLTRDGDFVSPLARMRAVHLLRELTGSPEEHFGNNLILEKILCGLPPGFALPSEWEPSEEEMEEVEGLLTAVCGYWQSLNGSSIQALREGFLLRPGTVEKFEDSWIVKVEGRTIDILMDDLPWELSLIFLPWLDNPISVEWQQE